MADKIAHGESAAREKAVRKAGAGRGWPTAGLRALAMAAGVSMVTSMATTSCTERESYVGIVIIDLNRTTRQPLTLTSVLSDSTRSATIRPDRDGVYAFATDTLPTDIYVVSLDARHRLPMLLTRGEGMKFCGTVAEWDKMTTSDEPTRVMMIAEQLRDRLVTMSYTTLSPASLSSPAGLRAAVNSLTSMRRAFRLEADSLLSRLADSSLASLPVMGLPGLYDDVADHELLTRRVCNMAARHPELSILQSKESALRRVGRLIALREKMAVGSDAPRFLFTSETGDQISESDLAGRRYALALMPDSASTPPRAVEMARQMAKEGVRILVEADSRVALADKNVIRGRFARMEGRGDMQLFAPGMVVVDKEGKIAGLWLYSFRNRQ